MQGHAFYPDDLFAPVPDVEGKSQKRKRRRAKAVRGGAPHHDAPDAAAMEVDTPTGDAASEQQTLTPGGPPHHEPPCAAAMEFGPSTGGAAPEQQTLSAPEAVSAGDAVCHHRHLPTLIDI